MIGITMVIFIIELKIYDFHWIRIESYIFNHFIGSYYTTVSNSFKVLNQDLNIYV